MLVRIWQKLGGLRNLTVEFFLIRKLCVMGSEERVVIRGLELGSWVY